MITLGIQLDEEDLMAFFKKTYEDNKSYRWVISALLVICLLVGIACVQFYLQVQGTVREESEHYLREIANRTSTNVKQIINNNFSALETFKTIIEGDEEKDFETLSDFLKLQVSNWEFTNILLIDDGGVAYDLEGKEVSITGDSFLRTLSLEGKIIAPTQMINNEEKTVFCVPLDHVTIDNKAIAAIATMYNPEQFDKILSMSAFDEKAFSYIVNRQGNVVVRSTSNVSANFGYNAIQTLLDNNPDRKKEINSMQHAMEANRSGQLDIHIEEEDQYLVYTPVGMDDWYLFSFIPVSVVNAKSAILLQSTILITGLIFGVFVLFLFIISKSYQRHRKRLEQIAYVDSLTEGHTIQRFYGLAEELLKESTMTYALVYTNVQRFKVLNDQFGRETCDKIIRNIHHAIASKLDEKECIAHYGADNFVVLVHYRNPEEIMRKFVEWQIENIRISSPELEIIPLYTVEYGIYIVDNVTISVDDMIDRSRLSLRNGSTPYKEEDRIRYAFYNEDVRHQLILEKHLEDMMEKSLNDNEFKVYLQPKYITATKTIGGAEALVRWDSKEDGMIYPNDFIPLFEKNGFIIKLDLWMFEQVCQLLQSWKDEGKTLIPISVNCSRVHLQNVDFLRSYREVFEKFDFPAQYLELEFTENMVFEETQRLAKVIDEIHHIGFSCSMDDFGSGYSSLNLLQDIHVDTLKLDRIFFKNTFSKSERTRAIISCILEMAQSLTMKTVAEGIEEWEQVDVLESMGCDFIQGYVYAKPMPIAQFEALLFAQKKGSGEDGSETK